MSYDTLDCMCTYCLRHETLLLTRNLTIQHHAHDVGSILDLTTNQMFYIHECSRVSTSKIMVSAI